MTTRQHYSIALPGRAPLVLGADTLVMGIVNVTPDSFADGGLRFDIVKAVEDGLRMLEEGAHILDVGGESTRPGAAPVPEDEELRRVLPVIEQLAARGALVSIDTYKAVVAREAIARGARIVNDVSGLQYDDGLGSAVAETGAALVLMHNRGRSRDMYKQAEYSDVPGEIVRELGKAIERATRAGVSREAIVVDPGIGFAKRALDSYAALATLDRLAELDRPVLSGPSRKSFLKAVTGGVPPAARDWATAGAVAASVLLGAHIVRVHAVREMVQVVRAVDVILSFRASSAP